MAMKPKAIRDLSPEDRAKLLSETRAELMHERGLAAMGGSVKNPGKIRDLRTVIARVLTIERQLGERGPHDSFVQRRAPAAPAGKAAKPAKAAKAPDAPSKAPAKPKAAKGAAAKTKPGGP
jgi:large subunit ribosomal protein L29